MSWSLRALAAMAAMSALPLLALVLVLTTTSGQTAIRPWPAVAIAAVAALGLVATTGRRVRLWIDLPLVASLGLAASPLLFAPGLPRGHDTLHHLWGVWAVAREVSPGNPFPVWLHGLGFGMPLLDLYGPAGFFVALPFSLAGLSPAAALKAAFLVFGAVAALGTYAAVASWTGDRRAALVAAAAYAFAPYRLLDTNYRGAFGESAGLAVLPLVFWLGSEAVRAGGRRRLAFGAAATALLIISHPLSALLGAVGLGIWTLAEILADRRSLLPKLGRLAAVWVLGATLAGFFVVPFAAGLRHTGVQTLVRGDGRSAFAGHGLVPSDLLKRREWSDLLPALLAQNPNDGTEKEMPYYFGLVLLALIPLGVGLGRAPKGLPWMTAAALILALRPVAGIVSQLLPPLTALQFPWRFLGLATFGAAALAGCAAARLLEAGEGRRWQVLVPGLLAALLVLDAFPYTGAADWLPAYEGFAFVQEPHPDCGRAWGCWEPVLIPPPYPVRAAGLLLPPTDPDIDVSLFCCAYPEFQTPAAQVLSFPSRSRLVLTRAGVGLFVGPFRQRLVRVPAQPYAVLNHGRRRSEPRPATRRGGEIVVPVDGKPGSVTVLEEYFPGWQVLTAGGWQEVQPTRSGLLRSPVGRGQTEARFRFRRWTRPRTAGWLLTGLTALGLTALCAGRPRQREAPPHPRG